MGFWSTLHTAFFGPIQTTGQQDGWLIRAVGGGKTAAGVSVSEWTALTLPVVYACVNRISNPVARFPVKILQSKAGGGSREVTDHPLSQKLGLRPNDYMSSRTMRKTIQGHALLWGNGYCEIERNQAGQAVGLWPLLPWNTRPRRDNGDFYYQTTIDGKTFRIEHGDVLHVMELSQDGYIGLSPITLARNAIGMAHAMEEFGAKFFANDAKSGGFLLHPGKLSAQAQMNLGKPKEQRTDPGGQLERQGGLDNAHRVKILEEGMKFVQTTIPPEDAQFLGSRLMQIAEVARMYDVPLVLLQSSDGVPSWGAGIEQLMIGFVRQTIEPWVAAWEQELNWKLFTEEERDKGYYVKFNMNAYLRGDSAARGAFYAQLFAVAGLSPNEILALEDMDPIGPEGDERFVSTNVVSLKNAINPPEPPAPVVAPITPKPDPAQNEAA